MRSHPDKLGAIALEKTLLKFGVKSLAELESGKSIEAIIYMESLMKTLR